MTVFNYSGSRSANVPVDDTLEITKSNYKPPEHVIKKLPEHVMNVTRHVFHIKETSLQTKGSISVSELLLPVLSKLFIKMSKFDQQNPQAWKPTFP